MQPQQREAGFLDFLTRKTPALAQHNHLSQMVSPKAILEFLRQRTRMDISELTSTPTPDGGVRMSLKVQEQNPVNRARVIAMAMESVTQVLEEILGSPVTTKVFWAEDDQTFDPNEGVAVYEILLRTPLANTGASRVATRVLFRRMFG